MSAAPWQRLSSQMAYLASSGFDLIGTAESLVGVFPERPLTLEDYQSGFSYGIFPAPGYLYWMGGLSTSGGSLEWLRAILGDPALTYAEIDRLVGWSS